MCAAQVARFRADAWDVLTCSVIGLIAECERRTGARADYVKSCLELLNPDFAPSLEEGTAISVVGDEAVLAEQERATDLAAAAWHGCPVTMSTVRDRSAVGLLVRCAVTTARSIASDLLLGKTNVAAASPSGWHTRSLGSPNWEVPTVTTPPMRSLTPTLPGLETFQQSLSSVTVITHALRPMMTSSVWISKQCCCHGRPPEVASCPHGATVPTTCIECNRIEPLTADDSFEVRVCVCTADCTCPLACCLTEACVVPRLV